MATKFCTFSFLKAKLHASESLIGNSNIFDGWFHSAKASIGLSDSESEQKKVTNYVKVRIFIEVNSTRIFPGCSQSLGQVQSAQSSTRWSAEYARKTVWETERSRQSDQSLHRIAGYRSEPRCVTGSGKNIFPAKEVRFFQNPDENVWKCRKVKCFFWDGDLLPFSVFIQR